MHECESEDESSMHHCKKIHSNDIVTSAIYKELTCRRTPKVVGGAEDGPSEVKICNAFGIDGED